MGEIYSKGIKMPYIESLFYYLLIIFAVLLFFYLLIFLGIIIANFLRGKSVQNATIKKVYKWFTILFLVFALGVYASKSAGYYAKGRAYPQAKAYAVVGDTLSCACGTSGHEDQLWRFVQQKVLSSHIPGQSF